MKLSFDEIISATTGAVRTGIDENGLSFYRFTAEQEEFFKSRSEQSFSISKHCAGIVVRFKTDSNKFFINTYVHPRDIRTYFTFDIFANGQKLEPLCNYKLKLENCEEPKPTVEVGDLSKEYILDVGEKIIEIHLPYSRRISIKEISLDDGAVFEPVKRGKVMITYGDSITHGFEAAQPTERYASKLCAFLGADEFCKAIGGDVFRPQEAALKDDFIPDYISVAYGTNDWYGNCRSDIDIANYCHDFCENLRKNYPETPIILITPIWRKDLDSKVLAGDFNNLANVLENSVKDIEGITLINGMGLVPEDETCFGDGRLHPNNKGFRLYSENLIKKLKELGY